MPYKTFLTIIRHSSEQYSVYKIMHVLARAISEILFTEVGEIVRVMTQNKKQELVFIPKAIPGAGSVEDLFSHNKS